MSVNGVTGASDLYSAYSAQNTATTPQTTATENASASSQTDSSGVVYEKSDTAAAKQATYANPALVSQLKSDAESRAAQLQSLVEKMMNQQGKAGSIWDALRTGQLEVDPATRAQAEEDVSEDGYWGVNKTSDRILDFAQALAGDDPDKLEEMREAFKKGYDQAQKTWGGELPEISQKTYDAVMSKFDDLIGSLQG
ncbi:MAG: hypothetical protein IJ058_03730 [Lachnospiraceae bacterium]|nr:hypothetical protein [Lachnospiraceae bacterium]